MDTSTVEIAKHTSARSSKRRMRTLQEKRQIVEEVLRGDESIAMIARRHAVNANLVFSWKRQYENGLLSANRAALVAVKVRKPPFAPARAVAIVSDECVEIDLGAGKVMRLRGEFARSMLERLITTLCER